MHPVKDVLRVLTQHPGRRDKAGVGAVAPMRGLVGCRAGRTLTAVALAVGLWGGAMAVDTPVASAALSAQNAVQRLQRLQRRAVHDARLPESDCDGYSVVAGYRRSRR